MRAISEWPSRLLVVSVAVGMAVVVCGDGVSAQAFGQQTFTYKTVGDVRIEADVYRVDDGVSRPVILWIHGGALIFGSRSGVPPQIKALAEDRGYVVVSIDYRLAPEVKLPEIVADLEDAIAWVRQDGPGLFGADPERLAVAGASAGGYMALLAGFRVTPRPTVIASFWGYGAADAPFDAEPSEHYRTTAQLVSREYALSLVGKGVLTATGPRMDGRWPYYLYLRQQGLWPEEVGGFGPDTQQAELDAYAPVRNMSAAFPPTVLVHGTDDTDVPYEESAGLAAELDRHDVTHELVRVDGAGHGLSGVHFDVLTEAVDRALGFVDRNLRPTSGEQTRSVEVSRRSR